MFGITMDVNKNVFFDNQYVCNNYHMPDSTVKKKHLAIFYHLVRKICMAGVMRVAWTSGMTNLSDVLTKSIPASNKKEIIGEFMRIRWRLYEGQIPKYILCVSERHIMRRILLWLRRYQSCFMVLMGTILQCKCDWGGRNCVIPVH